MGALVIPVALFAYKRADHLQRTINSLKKNYLSENVELYVFSDGPKKSEDKACVQKVRAYIQNLTGFSKVSVIESPENKGLSKSIISGVSKILETHDRVIVIEDDLELSPYFLTYMNEALNLYQHNPLVASVHGYTLPVKTKLPDTFFLKGADCWGWGTWQRAWDTFEQDGSVLLNNLNKQSRIREFDLDGLVGNTQMLKDQIAGKNDSWAIRWHASCFLNNMLTLHPGHSLVKNIGLDGSGQHCVEDLSLDTKLTLEKPNIQQIDARESAQALMAYQQFYKSQRRPLVIRALQAIREKLC